MLSVAQLEEGWPSIYQRVVKAAQKANRALDSIAILPVSKQHSVQEILKLMQMGCDCVGENKVQEVRQKQDAFEELGKIAPKWHMIGRLQSNKVSAAVALFDMIHSVHSVPLAQKINEGAAQKNKCMPICVQVNVSGELAKQGCLPEELPAMVERVRKMPHLKLSGLMTMAPDSADQDLVRECFARLKELARQEELEELSMGMSNDFELAIEEGATIVRLGRIMFAENS